MKQIRMTRVIGLVFDNDREFCSSNCAHNSASNDFNCALFNQARFKVTDMPGEVRFKRCAKCLELAK